MIGIDLFAHNALYYGIHLMSDEVNGAAAAAGDSVSASVDQAISVNDAGLPDKPAASAREAVDRALARHGFGVEREAGNDRRAEADGTPADAAAKSGGPQRDPATGQFVKGEAARTEPAADGKPAAPAADAKPAEATKATPAAPVADAPKWLHDAGKAAWAQIPEAARATLAAEFDRRHAEVQAGLEKYKDVQASLEKYKGAAEAFEPVRKFDEMARQSGTTLDKALAAYVGIEDAWRKNPAHGFAEVCRNLGADPVAMAQYVLQTLTGAGVPRGGDSPEVVALKQQIAGLESRLGEFGSKFEQSQQTAQQREAIAQVERFADAHPYYAELEPTIAELLETKFAKTLSDAYDKALRLNPEVAAKIEAEKAEKAKPAEAAQPRKANLSIAGAPSHGSHQPTKPSESPRGAVDRAFAQLGL